MGQKKSCPLFRGPISEISEISLCFMFSMHIHCIMQT